jgi:hypothetical protein
MEALVPSRTISSVMDEKVAGAVADVARIEDRTPSQIVNAAVRMYTRLPTAARQALRTIDALGTEEERAEAIWTVARSLSAAAFGVASRRGAEQIAANNPELMNKLKDATEEEIQAEAVRLCREAGWPGG